MTQKPSISVQDTTKFLQDFFSNKFIDVTLLSGGEWSQAYSFFYNNQKYVIRWCNSSETFEKDAFAYTFLNRDLPVPKITHTGVKYKKYYAISEFVEGNFIESLKAEELEITIPALLRLFDALRTADLTQTSGYGGWDKQGVGVHTSWREYLLDVKNDSSTAASSGWLVNLKRSSMGTKVFDKLYEKLEKLVIYCPEQRELIHSDLINLNLLVKDSGINGVIDWQCSLYGDSLYDIAWFAYYAPWYPQFESTKLVERAIDHFKSTAQNTSHIEERLHCYFLHIGLGSIAYNSFKQDWKAAGEAEKYTRKITLE